MAAYRSTGKELRKSPKGPIAGLLAFLLTAGAAYGIKYVLDSMEPIAGSADISTEISIPDVSDNSAENAASADYGSETHAAAEMHNGPLSLISEDFPTEDIPEGILPVFDKKLDIIAVRDLTVQLHTDAADAINELAEAFRDETGLADLLVLNGYITKDEQRKRYEAKPNLYALPGCSEFESGYSFEFSLYAHGTFQDFTTEDDHKWIAEHCAEFGIVQRYPESRKDVTGVSNRPEVFRYVGKPHAWYMYENDLCLEEYSELLDSYSFEGEHFRLTDADGQEYEVYTVIVDPNDPSPDVEIPVPVGCHFNVSGNNKNGFIVTVELD